MSDQVSVSRLESFFSRELAGVPMVLIVGSIAAVVLGVGMALLMK